MSEPTYGTIEGVAPRGYPGNGAPQTGGWGLRCVSLLIFISSKSGGKMPILRHASPGAFALCDGVSIGARNRSLVSRLLLARPRPRRDKHAAIHRGATIT